MGWGVCVYCVVGAELPVGTQRKMFIEKVSPWTGGIVQV